MIDLRRLNNIMKKSSYRLYLTFHGIGEPKIPINKNENMVWVSRKLFVEFCEFVRQNKENINITFDDGNISDFEVAFPELKNRELSAIYFVLTGRIDRLGYLSRNNLRLMAEENMEIGLHGNLHKNWRLVEIKELTKQLDDSKKFIEDIIGKEIKYAACPFGSYNRKSYQNSS